MAAEHKRKDEEILAGLGYKQEFKRAFMPLEVFGIGFSIIGLLPSIASTIGFALPNGGPVALVWGWTIVSVFVVFIGLALGELASAAPTSGGLYYWTYKYASPEWRCVLSWVVGYCNTMGNASGVASVAWGGAVQLMAAVSIGSNMTFAPTTAQLYGVFLAILVLAGIVSSAATHLIARLQGIYVYLNVLLCLAIIVGLPAATPSELKNTADYAFTGFDNLSGWTPGFAFILSFLAPLWTIGGFDGPIHISEEASNAATAVPWAIVSAIGITGVLGFAVNVAFSFNMGTDMAAIMSNPIGQPMATIFFNSFGTRGTLALWSVVVLIQFMMCTSILTSCSRQAFAFSRDGALPFSRFLYRMNPRTRTPVNCVWAAVLVAAVLGLLAFAGPSAINAIFSLGVTGQYLAFCLPIGSRFLGGSPWRPGPFSLGSLGMPVSLVAVLWMIFSVITVCFPAAPNPDGKTMNYTVVVAGGWISLCLTYFYFPKYGGRYWFKGPISNVELETPAEQVSETDSDEKASQ